MATISSQALFKAWKLETMTPEMTIGHIVQNLVILREDVDRLIAHTRLPPNTNTKGKAKPSKPGETPEPEQPS